MVRNRAAGIEIDYGRNDCDWLISECLASIRKVLNRTGMSRIPFETPKTRG